MEHSFLELTRFFSLSFTGKSMLVFPQKKPWAKTQPPLKWHKMTTFGHLDGTFAFLYAAVRSKYKLCLNKDKTILISYGLHSVSLSSMHIRQNLLSFWTLVRATIFQKNNPKFKYCHLIGWIQIVDWFFEEVKTDALLSKFTRRRRMWYRQQFCWCATYRIIEWR